MRVHLIAPAMFFSRTIRDLVVLRALPALLLVSLIIITALIE